MATTAVICANPECRVAESGKCIEGVVDVKACPHYGKPPQKDAAEAAAAAAGPARTTFRLFPGEYLTLSDTASMLLKHPSRVISLIGPTDAGKTSLMAAVFELFHQNKAAPIRFAGSQSLFALERACFHSRVTSAGLVPTHEHTQRGPAQFYHLSVKEDRRTRPIDLFLADRAGEEYSDAASKPVPANDFPELWRADTITLLVDGGRLTDATQRFDVIPNLKLMLDRFAELKAFWNRPRLACVLTKLDKVRDSASHWPSQQLARLKSDISTRHGQHFSAIEVFEVAASPHTASATRGEGILDVLKFWMHGRPELVIQNATPAMQPERFFAAFTSDGDRFEP